MLPIARNRSFHVPHGLAALAAAVCLVIAFTSEDSYQHQSLVNAATGSSTQPVTVPDSDQHELPPHVDATSRDNKPVRHSSASWIPWFPGQGSAGG